MSVAITIDLPRERAGAAVLDPQPAPTAAPIEPVALRRVCAWCKCDLPGSNREAGPLDTTHGMCQPLCGPAKAMGFSDL